MKYVLFSVFVVFAFCSCSTDIKSLSLSECKKLGYKYTVKKRLNYRTGKYETTSICENTSK